MNLVQEIKQVMQGEVLDDEITLTHYSHDASVFEVKPEAVVFPRDVEDVKQLVRFVNKKKKEGRNISLTPRAAGTDMSGGPLNESIIVDFTKYFNRIKKIENGYAVVEPGVFYRDFENKTLKQGYCQVTLLRGKCAR